MLLTCALASARLAAANPGSVTRTMSCPPRTSGMQYFTASRSSLFMRLRSTALAATCFDTTMPNRTPSFFAARAFKKRRPSLTPLPFPNTSLKSLVLRSRAVWGSIVKAYGVRRLRPFCLRLCTVFLPPFVLFLFKKPWVPALFFFFGWYVILIPQSILRRDWEINMSNPIQPPLSTYCPHVLPTRNNFPLILPFPRL